MPRRTRSGAGFVGTALTFAGGVIGAFRGAVSGARASATIAHELAQTRIDVDKRDTVIEFESRPYHPELHFPPRPGPDWHDPLPARLPKPTYAPATLAFGISLAAAGVVTHFWVSLAGGILFVLGLSHWIRELAHEHK